MRAVRADAFDRAIGSALFRPSQSLFNGTPGLAVIGCSDNRDMLTTSLHTRDIPAIYARFAKEVGEHFWKNRVALLKREMKGNTLLERLHRQEDAITFQLEQLRELQVRYGGLPVEAYNDTSHYSAASFAAQVLSVLDASDAVLADRFRRRVCGALKNPADMRAIRFELATATHFLRAGRRVSWPEMNATASAPGGGISDLLIEDLGPQGLEVECKSFSDEKGRRIGRRQALEFYWLLKKRHWDRLKRLQSGLVAVVTVPGNLPTEYKLRASAVDTVARLLLHCDLGQYAEEGLRVTLSEFDVRRLGAINATENSRQVRDLLDELTGTRNKETVVMGTKGGALVMAVQSEEDDTLLDGIFETLRSSASRQFSGNRPGIFVAGLDGLSAEQLVEVAQREHDPDAAPTSLRVRTSQFLSSTTRPHLVGVSFLSASALRPSLGGAQETGGSAYFFSKKDSPYWSEDLNGIFQEHALGR